MIKFPPPTIPFVLLTAQGPEEEEGAGREGPHAAADGDTRARQEDGGSARDGLEEHQPRLRADLLHPAEGRRRQTCLNQRLQQRP